MMTNGKDIDFTHAIEGLMHPHFEDEEVHSHIHEAPDKEYCIRFAHFEEFPVLISMWKTCFNDTDRAAANIFMELQRPENIMVLIAGNKVASMLSIRQFTLYAPTRQCKAAYIYGVATLPEFQGKGYSTILLGHLEKLLQYRGFACAVLVPANEGLFEFYKKRGYETAFNINKASFKADELAYGKTYQLGPVTPDKFAYIRDARFSDSKMFVRWDEDYLAYIAKESEFYGGGVLGFDVDGKQIYAVCYRDGDAVYVKELAATFMTTEIAMRSIKAYFEDAKEFVFYLREDVKISYTNNLLPFGMIQWYDNDIKSDMQSCGGAPAYLTHVLD